MRLQRMSEGEKMRRKQIKAIHISLNILLTEAVPNISGQFLYKTRRFCS